MTEQEIQVGDKVRLTYEGTVTNATSSGFGLDDGSYFGRPAARGSCRVVEILEKRKPQIGDVIPAGVLRFLPAGTIVLTDTGVAWSKTIAEGRWASWFRPSGLTDEEFFRPSFARSDLTIVYVP